MLRERIVRPGRAMSAGIDRSIETNDSGVGCRGGGIRRFRKMDGGIDVPIKCIFISSRKSVGIGISSNTERVRKTIAAFHV